MSCLVVEKFKKFIKKSLTEAIPEEGKPLEFVGLLLIVLSLIFSIFDITRMPAYFFLGVGLIFFFKDSLKEFNFFGLTLKLEKKIKEAENLIRKLRKLEMELEFSKFHSLLFSQDGCESIIYSLKDGSSSELGKKEFDEKDFFERYIAFLKQRHQILKNAFYKNYLEDSSVKKMSERTDKSIIGSGLVSYIEGKKNYEETKELNELLQRAEPCSFKNFSQRVKAVLDNVETTTIPGLDKKIVISLIEKILDYHANALNKSDGSDLVAYLEDQYKKYEEKFHGH